MAEISYTLSAHDTALNCSSISLETDDISEVSLMLKVQEIAQRSLLKLVSRYDETPLTSDDNLWREDKISLDTALT